MLGGGVCVCICGVGVCEHGGNNNYDNFATSELYFAKHVWYHVWFKLHYIPLTYTGGPGGAGDQAGLAEDFGNLHLGNEVPPPNGDVTSFENPNAEGRRIQHVADVANSKRHQRLDEILIFVPAHYTGNQ